MRYFLFTLFTCVCLLRLTAQSAPEERASLEGRVIDASNRVVQAVVLVYGVWIKDGIATLVPRCRALTAANGQYECVNLEGGAYVIEVVPRDPTDVGKNPDHPKGGSGPPEFVFFPSVADVGVTDAVTLSAGKSSWSDLRIADTDGALIRGVVHPWANRGSLSLDASFGGLSINTGIHPTYDPQSGKFILGRVPPGEYVLNANLSSDTREYRGSTSFVVTSREVNHVDVYAQPLCILKGRINNPSAISNIELLLYRIDKAAPVISTTTKSGAFSFSSVPAGEYVLALSSETGMYVEGLTVNRKESDGPRFGVAAGVSEMELVVNLTGPTFALRGSVTGEIMDGQRVEVIAQSEDSGEIYETLTNSQNNFIIRGLSPGAYRVFAWSKADLVEYRNPLVLQKYERDSSEVSIEAWGMNTYIVLQPLDKAH